MCRQRCNGDEGRFNSGRGADEAVPAGTKAATGGPSSVPIPLFGVGHQSPQTAGLWTYVLVAMFYWAMTYPPDFRRPGPSRSATSAGHRGRWLGAEAAHLYLRTSRSAGAYCERLGRDDGLASPGDYRIRRCCDAIEWSAANGRRPAPRRQVRRRVMRRQRGKQAGIVVQSPPANEKQGRPAPGSPALSTASSEISWMRVSSSAWSILLTSCS